MPYTWTATAYANSARQVHAGLNCVTARTTSASGAGNTLSASANAATFIMCKIPNKALIVDVIEWHSCGAATCLADVGIDSTLSAFASQVTQGQRNNASVIANLPYKVNNADTVIPSYSSVKVSLTAGTNTAVAQVNVSVLYYMAPDLDA